MVLAEPLAIQSTQKKTIRLLYAKTMDGTAQLLFRAITISVNKKGVIAQPPPRFIKNVTAIRWVPNPRRSRVFDVGGVLTLGAICLQDRDCSNRQLLVT